MNLSYNLIPSICNICQEKFRRQYKCKTCSYTMCISCYQSYLNFKYTKCPQCRENLNIQNTNIVEDIVPSMTYGTLKTYLKVYLVSILAAICYWVINPD